jgi:hypothetical protein
LYSFCDTSGASVRLRVQGAPSGRAWGTDVYTSDSTVAFAAVHAGLVADGRVAEVQAVCSGPQIAFAGTARNGLSTMSWGPFSASFTLQAAAPVTSPAVCTGRCVNTLCAVDGQVIHVTVTGESNAADSSRSVWGGADGIYTDDSWLPAAVVHAGLVSVGQTAHIVATCRGSQTAFTGSTANGVFTASYGLWVRSVSLEVSQP